MFYILHLNLRKIITPNLVVLEPASSLRCVDHYYAICSHDWCDVNFYCTMFVCIATSSREVMSHLKTKLVPGNLESNSSCVLDHTSLPNNVPVNHCNILKLIWWDLICFPSIVYPPPCKQMNYWVDLLLFYLVLGLMLHLNYDHVPIMLLF